MKRSMVAVVFWSFLICQAQTTVFDQVTTYKKDLENNPRSSLTHYRIARIFFDHHDYQSAANEFRETLNGDLNPKWTQAWALIYLGMIFDTTGQRERAVNQYRLAIDTHDETRDAQEEASRYLKLPFSSDRQP